MLKPKMKTPATHKVFGRRIRCQLLRTLFSNACETSIRVQIFARLSSMKTICAVSVAMVEAPRSEIETFAFFKAIESLIPSPTKQTVRLEKAGVKTGARGLVNVNENFQTNIEHIYAAGDAIGFPALASTSMEQARRAALHALNLAGRTISPILPAGIYTIPEVSMVGETEESLQKKDTAYIVGRANYRENARGRIIGDQESFLKLLFRQADLKLIGVHVMGELATEVVHIGLIAMMGDASANLFVEACLNMPTLGMLYKTATLDALQKFRKSQKDT